MRDFLIGRPYRLTLRSDGERREPVVATFMGYLVGRTDEWLGTVWRPAGGSGELRLPDAEGPLEAEEIHEPQPH